VTPLLFLNEGGVFFISARENISFIKNNRLEIHLKKALPATCHSADNLPTRPDFFTPRKKITGLILAAVLPFFLIFSKNTFLYSSSVEPRVISLAPSLTEIICELGAGDNLVGVTNLCDYPPDITLKASKIGSIGSFSSEKIISLKPDIVFTLNSNDRVSSVIKKSGIKVIEANPQSIKELTETIIRFGKILKKQNRAFSLIKEIEIKTEEIKRKSASVRRGKTGPMRIYIEIYYPPPWSASRNSFIGELAELMGFENIFSKKKSGGLSAKDYFTVSLEEVVSEKPDVALVLSGDTKFRNRNGFENLPAVKNNLVIYPDDSDMRAALVRATPRMIRASLKLQERILEAIRDKNPDNQFIEKK